MATYKKKLDFFATQEGDEFKQTLREMERDNSFITESGYSANAELYPDHSISFVDRHVAYIKAHPSTDPSQYLSNLKLMTRVRR